MLVQGGIDSERWTWWDVVGMFGVIRDQGYTEVEVAGWFSPLDP